MPPSSSSSDPLLSIPLSILSRLKMLKGSWFGQGFLVNLLKTGAEFWPMIFWVEGFSTALGCIILESSLAKFPFFDDVKFDCWVLLLSLLFTLLLLIMLLLLLLFGDVKGLDDFCAFLRITSALCCEELSLVVLTILSVLAKFPFFKIDFSSRLSSFFFFNLIFFRSLFRWAFSNFLLSSSSNSLQIRSSSEKLAHYKVILIYFQFEFFIIWLP